VQLDWNCKYDPHGNLVGFVVIVADITKRLQFETRLKSVHDNLKQEVLERTAMLNAVTAYPRESFICTQ